MTRLLFLSPFAPRLDATHGGSRAIAQLIVHLAGRNPAALLYFCAPGEPPLDEAVRRACGLAREVIRGDATASPQARRREQLRTWAGLPAGRPTWVTHWSSPNYAAELAALAREWRPEIVQVEFHVMAQYLPALRGITAPRILNQHDPGTQAARDRRTAGRGGRLLPRLDAQAWERYERRIYRQVDAVVAFTDHDAQAVKTLAPSLRTVTIPLGTELPAQPLDPLGSSPPGLLFIGSLHHAPNMDAALRLARAIFPPLRADHPDLALYIVGPGPSPLPHGMDGEGVRVTGEVPDVRPYVDAASMVVAPLRMGGGMRVKVLEALAAGKALIATPRAVEGLHVTDREQVILVESDEDFRCAADWLLRNPAERASLGTRARAWAVANLGWDRSVAAYEALYATLLADGRQAARDG